MRLYLNGSHVADALTADDGKWSLTITKGVSGGKYALRADVVDKKDKVVSRAEVPFEAPVAVASAVPVAPVPAPSVVAGPPAAASQPGPSPAAQPPAAPAPASAAASAGAGPPGPESQPGPSPAAQSPPPAAASVAQTAGLQPSQPSAASAPSHSAPPIIAADPSPSIPQHAAATIRRNDATSNPVIPEISTATVAHGDSLWRISRVRWGKGKRYTVIYEANAAQIRNPDLIYPGQVLVMPH